MAVAFLALIAGACDKAALLGPQNSTISVIASARVLPVNGTTSISATVLENSGSPVPNGTTVRFTTNLGRVDPAEAQTTNGVATTTFHAGETSGIADVRAFSGLAKPSTTTAATPPAGTPASSGSDVVQIMIGAAAVETVTVRVNPSSVSPSGSTVEVIANVLGPAGRALSGIVVTFGVTAGGGTFSNALAITDGNGDARTQLTTNVNTTVSAAAGSKAPATASVTVRPAAGLTLTVTPASPVAGQPITLAVAPATGTAPRVSVNWGDGASEDLGVVASSRAVAHTYANGGSYTIVATATADGESFSTSAGVVVAFRQPLAVNITATDSTANTPPATSPQTWSFEAVVTPSGANGSDSVERYEWDFGDGSTATTSGNRTQRVYTCNTQRNVSVTIRTTDGRTATGRTQINVTDAGSTCSS